MIQQTLNDVNWISSKLAPTQKGVWSPKITGKSWTKELEETETDATASWGENIDESLSDFESSQFLMVTIQICGQSFSIDCFNVQNVKKFLQRLGSFQRLRQKSTELKMVILDRLCKQNNKLMPLLDQACKQYSQKKEKQLFR